MALQPDIWMALEQWKADNQRLNHPPRWQVDQFVGAADSAECAEVPSRPKPGQALAWLGRNLTVLGIWLQNRYGDACLIEVDVDPRTACG